MPNQTYQPIIVTGINPGDEHDENEVIVRAHSKALELFEPELVSALTPIGHNFIQSFCVFPSGSGNQRDAQLKHQRAVVDFCQWLETMDLEYVAIKWDDDEAPLITNSHEDVFCMQSHA